MGSPQWRALIDAVLATTHDAVIATNTDGMITAWSDAAQRLYGLSVDETIERSFAGIVPAERTQAEAEIDARVQSGETIRDVHTIRRCGDGRLLPVRMTASPIRADDGAVVGRLRIEREDAPQDDWSHRRLAAIVESSDDAIVGKDPDGIVTSWNAAAERMFGYPAEEMIGRSIRGIIPNERQGEEDEVLARIGRGERVDHFETVRRRKDGSFVPISLTVSPIRDATGRVIGASKIARDVSERQRLQREFEQQVAVTRQVGDIGAALASTLDRDTIVQKVTDAATELTTAEFGAFFYNVHDPTSGESYTLYTLSGVPKEAFAGFPQPRATEMFGPTVRGQGVVRVDDVTADPR